jgi:hypothetical protein
LKELRNRNAWSRRYCYRHLFRGRSAKCTEETSDERFYFRGLTYTWVESYCGETATEDEGGAPFLLCEKTECDGLMSAEETRTIA